MFRNWRWTPFPLKKGHCSVRRRDRTANEFTVPPEKMQAWRDSCVICLSSLLYSCSPSLVLLFSRCFLTAQASIGLYLVAEN